MHFPVGKANIFHFLNLLQSLSHLMTGPDMSRQLWLLHGPYCVPIAVKKGVATMFNKNCGHAFAIQTWASKYA